MIFVILGIGVLTVSFIIAFISLVKEQKSVAQNAKKTLEENQGQTRAKKPHPFLRQQKIDIPSKKIQIAAKDGQKTSLTDDRFPWEEEVKQSIPAQEPPGEINEQSGDTADIRQKLGGEISIGDLVRKRKIQKESISR